MAEVDAFPVPGVETQHGGDLLHGTPSSHPHEGAAGRVGMPQDSRLPQPGGDDGEGIIRRFDALCQDLGIPDQEDGGGPQTRLQQETREQRSEAAHDLSLPPSPQANGGGGGTVAGFAEYLSG
jgi:hypothetical protein